MLLCGGGGKKSKREEEEVLLDACLPENLLCAKRPGKKESKKGAPEKGGGKLRYGGLGGNAEKLNKMGKEKKATINNISAKKEKES